MTRSMLSTKGFEEYLEKLAQAGEDIDQIADEALSAGAEIIKNGMDRRAPEKTKRLKNKISIDGPVNNGNFHTVKIGIFNVKRPEELYFFYQEHGSARGGAHPFIRPAMDEDMKHARAKMLEVFKRKGAL